MDLRERGTPDESRNQLLEEFLLTEASLLLSRKGYTVVDSGASALLRVYFGVSEKKAEQLEAKNIGYASLQGQPGFLSNILLQGGLWQSASVSTAMWTTLSKATYYEAEITLELYSIDTNKQLWRGDVFISMDSRDIRTSSNYMFRDLLWSFPAISYARVVVPKAEESEFETLWENFVENREFFIPGSRHHISFAFKEYMANESEAEAVFKTTPKYEQLKQSCRPWETLEETRPYRDAFLKWYKQDGANLKSIKTKEIFRDKTDLLPAYIDLMQTCPISYVDQQQKIHLVGEYEISGSTHYLHLVATPQRQPYIFISGMTRYYKTKYHAILLEELKADEYVQMTKLAQQQREEQIGLIDAMHR